MLRVSRVHTSVILNSVLRSHNISLAAKAMFKFMVFFIHNTIHSYEKMLFLTSELLDSFGFIEPMIWHFTSFMKVNAINKCM